MYDPKIVDPLQKFLKKIFGEVTGIQKYRKRFEFSLNMAFLYF